MGQRYVQHFYNARSGELGEAFITQKQVRAYHSGLYKANNVTIDAVGNIAKRAPFVTFGEAPASDNNFNYRIVSLEYPDQFFPREKTKAFFVFGENTVDCWKKNYNEVRWRKVFSKVTPHSALLMSQCTLCEVPKMPDDNNVLGNSFVFCHQTKAPFTMHWRSPLLTEADISFNDLSLKNLPYEQVDNIERSGSDLGTGTVTFELKEEQWMATATNNAFVVGTNWEGGKIFTAQGATFRIRNRVDDKSLTCDALSVIVGNKISNVQPADISFSLGWRRIAYDNFWFSCCCWFKNRLCLGGTQNSPGVVVTSAADNPLDFRPSSYNYPNGGFFGYLNTTGGDFLTALAGGSALHAFTANTVNILRGEDLGRGHLGVTFTQIASDVGSDCFTQTPQLSENGLCFLNGKANRFNYVSFSDQGDASSYKVDPIGELLPDGLIDQSDATFALIVIQEGNIKGRSAYFINSYGEIVKLFLTLSEQVVAGYTRFVFDNRIEILNIFSVENNLIAVARINNTSVVLAELSTDVDAPERLGVDFCRTIEAGEEQFAPAEFHGLDNLYAIGDGRYALVSVSGENGEINGWDGSEMKIGFPIEVFVTTMPLVGNPEIMNYGVGKLRRVRRVRFGNACFTSLRVGIREGYTSEIDENKPSFLFKTYRFSSTAVPCYDRQSLSSLTGSYAAPQLVLNPPAVAPFRYSSMEAEIEFNG